MVDNTKKKRTEGKKFTIAEAVNALVKALKEADYPINFGGFNFKYHIDIGMLVKLEFEELPDFPVYTTWLMDSTGYEWLVNSIEPCKDSKNFEVVFILEEEI